MSMKLKKMLRESVGTDSTQTSDISSLKTTVGNNSSGLVKDVNDLKTKVAALEAAAATPEETPGGES